MAHAIGSLHSLRQSKVGVYVDEGALVNVVELIELKVLAEATYSQIPKFVSVARR